MNDAITRMSSQWTARKQKLVGSLALFTETITGGPPGGPKVMSDIVRRDIERRAVLRARIEAAAVAKARIAAGAATVQAQARTALLGRLKALDDAAAARVTAELKATAAIRQQFEMRKKFAREQAHDALIGRAGQIFEQTRTPLERATAGAKELYKVWETSTMTVETYDRALQQLVDSLADIDKATKGVQMARVITAIGSVSNIGKALGGPNDAQGIARKTMMLNKQQLEFLRKNSGYLQEMAEKNAGLAG